MNLFDDESEKPISKPINKTNRQYFELSDEQRNNLNKRLPRGFCLVKINDYERERLKTHNAIDDNDIEIEYCPVRKKYSIDPNNVFTEIINQMLAAKAGSDPKKAKMVTKSIEGCSRQVEKIKNIIQRFRKHARYPQLANFLNKTGLMQGLNQIESENKKNILTIDTFRQRFLLVLETARNCTYQQNTRQLIDQMIEQLVFQAQQARKTEFENNIQSVQKSIDKITRYVSQSNYYVKKKKKSDKAEIQYTHKQIIQIGSLIGRLPIAYLLGVWEIIEERAISQCPVTDNGESMKLIIKLSCLSNRKLRDIEIYVRGKLSLIYKSKEQKAEKIKQKKLLKEKQVLSKMENKGNGTHEISHAIQQNSDEQDNNSKQQQYNKQSVLGDPEFEQLAIQCKTNKQDQIQEQQDSQLSDSSMITDEDQSDF